MITLSRPQREALAAVFKRTPMYQLDGRPEMLPIQNPWPNYTDAHKVTYREFRRTVVPELYGDAILINWCGMWLGIEKDGYCHS